MKTSFIQSLLTLMWKLERRLIKSMKKNTTQLEATEQITGVTQKKEDVTLTSQQKSEEDQNKPTSSEIVKRYEYNIFEIIETEQGCFIALGNNRLSELQSKNDCIEQIDKRDYKLLFNVIAVTSKAFIAVETNKTEINNN